MLDTGKELYEQFLAVTLAFSDDYDYIKYNGKVPVADANWETYSHKWTFNGLATHFDGQLKTRTTVSPVTASEFPKFLMFLAGEGYQKLSSYQLPWITDVRAGTGSVSLFQNWNDENNRRYECLEDQLRSVRQKVQTLEDFKQYVSCCANGDEPPMLKDIGYRPDIRANRRYVLTLQSFFLLDNYLKLLDTWNTSMKGEPCWDEIYKRLSVYRKLYFCHYPFSQIKVRKIINAQLNFP